MKKSFENKIKNIIIPTVVSGFENLNWEVGGYSDGVIYEFVQVVPQHDTWSYDDIFRGEHKGVKFEISESKFYKKLFPEYTDRRGERQNGIMRKVFQGIVIKIEMNKNFSGHTLIKPNTLLHNPPMEYLSRTISSTVEITEKIAAVFQNMGIPLHSLTIFRKKNSKTSML
jgi:hypothetical protein